MTPSRASKSALARCAQPRRSRVTSTSTTVVSWAETCSDSTIRCGDDLAQPRHLLGTCRAAAGPPALRCRRSRRAGAAGAAGAAGRPAAAAARGRLARRACARPPPARPACGSRPPTPVPVSAARSTPCSAASLRTSGVTYRRRRRQRDAGAGAARGRGRAAERPRPVPRSRCRRARRSGLPAGGVSAGRRILFRYYPQPAKPRGCQGGIMSASAGGVRGDRRVDAVVACYTGGPAIMVVTPE